MPAANIEAATVAGASGGEVHLVLVTGNFYGFMRFLLR